VEEFVVEIRFRAETDMTSPQIERRLLGELRRRLDWLVDDDSLDCEVMARTERGTEVPQRT
jgi:hypothetical protein